MKVKAVKVNRAHYFLTEPRICNKEYIVIVWAVVWLNCILRSLVSRAEPVIRLRSSSLVNN